MEALTGFAETLILIAQVLFWAMNIYYGFIGLTLLVKRNPKRDEQTYKRAFTDAGYLFFFTIIAIPAIIYLASFLVSDEITNLDLLAHITLIYLIGLLIIWLVGIVNYLIAD